MPESCLAPDLLAVEQPQVLAAACVSVFFFFFFLLYPSTLQHIKIIKLWFGIWEKPVFCPGNFLALHRVLLARPTGS